MPPERGDEPVGGGALGGIGALGAPTDTGSPGASNNFARTGLHPIGDSFCGTRITSMLHPIEAGICA